MKKEKRTQQSWKTWEQVGVFVVFIFINDEKSQSSGALEEIDFSLAVDLTTAKKATAKAKPIS